MMTEKKYICPDVGICRGFPECVHSILHEQMVGCLDDDRCPKCILHVPKQAAKTTIGKRAEELLEEWCSAKEQYCCVRTDGEQDAAADRLERAEDGLYEAVAILKAKKVFVTLPRKLLRSVIMASSCGKCSLADYCTDHKDSGKWYSCIDAIESYVDDMAEE